MSQSNILYENAESPGGRLCEDERQTATFFPKDWPDERILEEVTYAIENNHGLVPDQPPSGSLMFGYSKDGVIEIRFVFSEDGTKGTYYAKKNKMKYTIKPFISCPDKKLVIFLSEIHQLKLSDLQDIVDSFEDVMNNESKELYWGWDISSLDMSKETTTLSYNSQIEAKIPTMELYNMLKAYRDKLEDNENEQHNV